MRSLKVRLGALEARDLITDLATAERVFAYCKSVGLDVPPVDNASVTEWFAIVPTNTLYAILNNHTHGVPHAKS